MVPETRGLDADEVDFRETQEKVQQKAILKRHSMSGSDGNGFGAPAPGYTA